MTDIEQKMQTLVDEARIGIPLASEWAIQNLALRRAIEQHEAFRQEVSDAVEAHYSAAFIKPLGPLARFIIAKPDLLVEAVNELDWADEYADKLRAAIEKRGGKIVWGEGHD